MDDSVESDTTTQPSNWMGTLLLLGGVAHLTAIEWEYKRLASNLSSHALQVDRTHVSSASHVAQTARPELASVPGLFLRHKKRSQHDAHSCLLFLGQDGMDELTELVHLILRGAPALHQVAVHDAGHIVVPLEKLQRNV